MVEGSCANKRVENGIGKISSEVGHITEGIARLVSDGVGRHGRHRGRHQDETRSNDEEAASHLCHRRKGVSCCWSWRAEGTQRPYTSVDIFGKGPASSASKLSSSPIEKA